MVRRHLRKLRPKFFCCFFYVYISLQFQSCSQGRASRRKVLALKYSRKKSEVKMSAGMSYLDVYQACLEHRLQRGDLDPVCRDEELCKKVETRLSECSPKNFHPQLRLDPLLVIEVSLRSSHQTQGQNRLKSLIKAFEVLELAALNLYLCPWRKEYKVVKMFSGMFTHCIKPALTAQQAKDLFALLGYLPASSNEEELRLTTKPVHSHNLLDLAWSFFIARIECQLLLTSMASLCGSNERVLQLIHEMRCGCPFQKALDSTKATLESHAPCDPPLALDATVDIYTDDSLAERSHMASPPSLLYIPPSTGDLNPSNTSRSNMEGNENKTQTISVSSLTCHINTTPQKTNSDLEPCDDERQFTAIWKSQHGASKERCMCDRLNGLYLQQCIQCDEIHSMYCPYFNHCMVQGHEVNSVQTHKMDAQSQTTQGKPQRFNTKPSKDNLKQHNCINKHGRDIFDVCHDCHYIHDLKCKELDKCYYKKHNVQSTGRLLPAQVEKGVTAHKCVHEDKEHAVCHTCNKSHSLLCSDLRVCQISSHNVEYLAENNDSTKPMPLHQCCTSTKPNFACFTCRVFHALLCDDNHCHGQHDVHNLKNTCCICSDTELYILCRYCCNQICKQCWFKDPMNCRCGMPFEITAV